MQPKHLLKKINMGGKNGTIINQIKERRRILKNGFYNILDNAEADLQRTKRISSRFPQIHKRNEGIKREILKRNITNGHQESPLEESPRKMM